MGTMLAEVNLIVDEVFEVYAGLDLGNYWDIASGVMVLSPSGVPSPLVRLILDEIQKSYPAYSNYDISDISASTKKQLYATVLQRLTDHKTKLDAIVVALDAIFDALP